MRIINKILFMMCSRQSTPFYHSHKWFYYRQILMMSWNKKRWIKYRLRSVQSIHLFYPRTYRNARSLKTSYDNNTDYTCISISERCRVILSNSNRKNCIKCVFGQRFICNENNQNSFANCNFSIFQMFHNCFGCRLYNFS